MQATRRRSGESDEEDPEIHQQPKLLILSENWSQKDNDFKTVPREELTVGLDLLCFQLFSYVDSAAVRQIPAWVFVISFIFSIMVSFWLLRAMFFSKFCLPS